MIGLGFSGIANGAYYQERYGLRFVGHDSSVALMIDGKLVFAVEEERLSREKHTSALPTNALGAAMEHAGIQPSDLDWLAYPWHVSPRRLTRMFLHHPWRIPPRHWPALAVAGTRVVRDLMIPGRAGDRFGRAVGAPLPRTRGVAHHMAHAACAYFTSPFDRAAVLTVDGQGEDESATLGEWNGTAYEDYGSIASPDSIGIVYGMVTDFLGMRAAWDEYKVMGMAARGDADRFEPAFRRLVQLLPGGRYRTRRTAMVFSPGYCDRFLEQVLGIPKRDRYDPLEQAHFDIAAALQSTTEDVLFHLLSELRARSTASDLCLAGGVFLNSVANGKILRSQLFDRVHIPPVPGDHGAALGAALLTHHRESGAARDDVDFTVFSGPGYGESRVAQALTAASGRLVFRRASDLVAETAQLLADQQIVAWFQGRVEYGPRALGHRSILASPLQAEMKDLINSRVKHREEYRPFAGAVPLELAAQYFEVDRPSPYMQFVLPVRADAMPRIPAVVHAGTCRAQTVAQEQDPLFHALLHAFGERTGVPVLLNTSFNDADEPIVTSPEDAVRTFLSTNLDALVIGPFIARKAAGPGMALQR